jgi:monoamine oxidase
MPMGSVLKVHALYDRPFWRDDGRTGQATSDTGPVKITYDNSPPTGPTGVLIGFIEGEEARKWGPRPLAQRRAAVIAQFAKWFGPPAGKPRAYVEQNWMEEEWSRGCYGAWAPPGVLLGYGAALRKPVGRIHWAGTETSTEWCGYMDGAVRSGERVAAEVGALL